MQADHVRLNKETSEGAPSDPNSDTSRERQAPRENGEKDAYSAPTLTRFGRLADLTGLTGP